MVSFPSFFKSFKGQTLLEVLVSMGIAVVVVGAIAVSVITGLSNITYSKNQNNATHYTEEGIEYLYQQRNLAQANGQFANFQQLFNGGPYCLSKPLPASVLSPTTLPKAACTSTQLIDGVFQRQIYFDNTQPSVCSQVVRVEVRWVDSRCTSGSYCHVAQESACLNKPASVANPLSLNVLSGLVGYWKLDDAAGPTITDSSSSSPLNNGTATGTTVVGPGLPACQISKCRSFNGSSDYINMPVGAGSSLDITGAVTIAAWVYPKNLNSTRQTIFGRGQEATNGYGISIGVNGNNKFNLGGFGGGNFDSNVTPTVNTWYYVVGVINGANSQLWISNGSTIAQDSTANIAVGGSSTAFPAQIGANSNTTPTIQRFFNGNIDEIAVWNRALTSDEINYIFSTLGGKIL